MAERGRIARDIHDNVGHLLARSIMQMGALITINENPEMAGGLAELKDSLTGAMDSVRESVHALHDESFDLFEAVKATTHNFTNVDVNLNYDMGELVPHEIKICFAAIVKEALANTVKHSGANKAGLSLQEHPKFYQLTFADNGAVKEVNAHIAGIGLYNMRQRTEALGGRFTLQKSKGYAIHITIPKKAEDTP